VGDLVVHALQRIDINITQGEFVAIMGASGSGKSTLMNIIGCLDSPTSGEYILDKMNINSLTKDEYADIRNQKIGFVFQGFNLLPRTTALENVELPLLYDRKERIKNPRQQAIKALESVGLAERINHVPNQLSGGQQQRVAIARALVNNPAIILADEPTGNLDSRTSIDVMSVLQKLNQQGKTIILVTHEPDIAQFAKRSIKLRDGKIIEDVKISFQKNAEYVLQSCQGDKI
jgi:putative ABC transport system ATP-binding protein